MTYYGHRRVNTRAVDDALAESMLKTTQQAVTKDANLQVLYGPDLAYKATHGHRRIWSNQRENSYAVQESEVLGTAKTSTFPSFLRETFSRLFTGNRAEKVQAKNVLSEGRWSQKIHGLLDDLPEWNRLTQRCRGSSFNSTLAVTAVADQMLEHIPNHKEDARAARQAMERLKRREAAGEEIPEKLKERAQQAIDRAAREADQLADSIDESAVRQALRAVVDNSNKEMDETEQAMSALGCGSDPGNPSASDNKTKRAVAEKLNQSPKLKQIMEQAGRMKIICQRAQETKAKFGTGELCDLELGDELSRLLPTELVQLVDEDFELLAMRKLLEHGAVQYRLEDKDPEGLGPIVVCVDDSGSMSGLPECWAKGLALSFMWLARAQKRAFAFCTFSGSLGVTMSETDSKRLGPTDILDRLIPFLGGGTNWDEPLQWAEGQIRAAGVMKKADIIFITDGICSLNNVDIHKEVLKELNTKVIGVIIDNPRDYAQNINSQTDGFEQALKVFCSVVFRFSNIVLEDGTDNTGRLHDDNLLRAVFSL